MYNDYSYLYVEDDSLSREVMEMILGTAMGVERLTMFADSRNLLERVHQLNPTPDVVLLDIHVKPMDGFEMLEVLRADAHMESAKFIALTASVMNEEVDRLRSSGFDGAIAKPLSVQVFPDLITRILQGEAVWHIA